MATTSTISEYSVSLSQKATEVKRRVTVLHLFWKGSLLVVSNDLIALNPVQKKRTQRNVQCVLAFAGC